MSVEPPPDPDRARWPRWVWPAAAAAAGVLLLWPRQAPLPPPTGAPELTSSIPGSGRAISSLVIAPAAFTRGGAAREWHAGDSFLLEFRLGRRAVPVVFVLDEQAAVARIHPAPGRPAEVVSAGDVQLPPRFSGLRWSFDGPPGPETFFVTSLPEGAAPDTLEARIERALERVAGRSARGDTLEAALRRVTGDVSRLDVVHR